MLLLQDPQFILRPNVYSVFVYYTTYMCVAEFGYVAYNRRMRKMYKTCLWCGQSTVINRNWCNHCNNPKEINYTYSILPVINYNYVIASSPGSDPERTLTSVQPILYISCCPPLNIHTFWLNVLFVFLICLYEPSPGCSCTFLEQGNGISNMLRVAQQSGFHRLITSSVVPINQLC